LDEEELGLDEDEAYWLAGELDEEGIKWERLTIKPGGLVEEDG